MVTMIIENVDYSVYISTKGIFLQSRDNCVMGYVMMMQKINK